MAKRKPKTREKSVIHRFTNSDETLLGYMIWCGGCKCGHAIYTEQTNSIGAIWKFNGNIEEPTFTPSIIVRWDSWEPPAEKLTGTTTQTKVAHVCHSFVTDGKMQFLSDSTHELAGQTVPLKPF